MKETPLRGPSISDLDQNQPLNSVKARLMLIFTADWEPAAGLVVDQAEDPVSSGTWLVLGSDSLVPGSVWCLVFQNCLRRRDAGLISQLQELDRQICDLRLDTDMSPEQLETDSRPSSGTVPLQLRTSEPVSRPNGRVGLNRACGFQLFQCHQEVVIPDVERQREETDSRRCSDVCGYLSDLMTPALTLPFFLRVL